jgi:hypothetical protein
MRSTISNEPFPASTRAPRFAAEEHAKALQHQKGLYTEFWSDVDEIEKDFTRCRAGVTSDPEAARKTLREFGELLFRKALGGSEVTGPARVLFDRTFKKDKDRELITGCSAIRGWDAIARSERDQCNTLEVLEQRIEEMFPKPRETSPSTDSTRPQQSRRQRNALSRRP